MRKRDKPGGLERPFKFKGAAQSARLLRRASTRTEDILWQGLRNRKLGGAKFRRQHRMGTFVVDFCCVNHRLVVEIDGAIHATTKIADRERQNWLESEGFRVLRVRAGDVETDLLKVLHRIEEALLSSLPSPLPQAGEGRLENTLR